MTEEYQQLNLVHPASTVKTKVCWGGPATGGRTAQRRAKRTLRRQLLTGCIPGEAKASTA
jgi:hypothetical protein